jgi:hypothetical protein
MDWWHAFMLEKNCLPNRTPKNIILMRSLCLLIPLPVARTLFLKIDHLMIIDVIIVRRPIEARAGETVRAARGGRSL